MRRPIAPVCGGFASGTALMYLLFTKYGAQAAGAFFVLALFVFAGVLIPVRFRREKAQRTDEGSLQTAVCLRAALLFGLAFLLAFLRMSAACLHEDAIVKRAGSECDFSGRVLRAEETKRGERYRMLLDTEEGRVLVTLYARKAGSNTRNTEQDGAKYAADSGSENAGYDGAKNAAGSSAKQTAHGSAKDYADSDAENRADSRVGDETDGAARLIAGTVGCTVTVRGAEFSLPADRRNPKCFDYRLYLRSQKTQAVASANLSDVTAEAPPQGAYFHILHAASVQKASFLSRLENTVGSERAAVLAGMLFGEKSLMDEGVYEEFQQNGTAHVLAVSGLHVGLVYACIVRIFRNKRSLAGKGVSLFLLFVYAAMAGFSPSVMRASLMIALHILAGIVHRRYDLFSAACLVMTGSLVYNPFLLFHSGFQLSYAAVIAIAVCTAPVTRLLGKGAAALVSVQLGVLPLTAYTFNYVSLGAFLANGPVLLLAGLVIPAGMAALVLSSFSALLFAWAAEAAALLCDMMIAVNRATYLSGLLTFDVTSPGIAALVLYYAVVLGGLTETTRILVLRRRFRPLLTALALFVLCAGALAFLTDDGFRKADFVFVDVGQGDCLHVRGADGRNYLVDGGGSVTYDVGKKTLKPYLLKNGVRRVDIAFVSHLHTDHYAGIVSLCKEGMVERLCLYEGNRAHEAEILAETGLLPSQLLYARKDDRVRIGESGSGAESKDEVLILSPPAPDTQTALAAALAQKSQPTHTAAAPDTQTALAAADANTQTASAAAPVEEEDENKTSLVMKVTRRGVSVLMDGDLSAEGERALLRLCGKEALSCTLLKAAHHGSRYSTCDEFLEAVRPQALVIQVGKNNYGHPAESVIENCRQKGIMVYRNDHDGAIGVRAGKCGGNARIFTMR